MPTTLRVNSCIRKLNSRADDFSFGLILILAFATWCVPQHTLAQDKASAEVVELELPDCDIFVFDMEETSDGLVLSRHQNVTNREGYDNQPWFTADSQSLLFSANKAADRTDIFEYVFETGATNQLTDTPTQEYSPQSSPDNQVVSFVTDGETANQSIWFTQRDQQTEEWLLANQGEREPVGYYSWNHETGYILYWSRYGYSMKLVHVTKEMSHYISGNASPTSPHIIPGTKRFSFMHRQANDELWIKELNPETLAVRPIVQAKGANRNYGWTPGGKIIAAENDKLFCWSPDFEDGWKEVLDFSGLSISGVTRVAVSPDGKKLAVVGLSAIE